jgi:CheY-like chemotaxis protein
MRILVVDDDSFAGEMTAAVLEGIGHEPLIADSGVDAMEKLAATAGAGAGAGTESGIELVISDMNMPLVSGIELFRELRAQGWTLPFILLTGDDPARLSREEPALDACLLKDGDLEERLPRVLADVLARHGRRP